MCHVLHWIDFTRDIDDVAVLIVRVFVVVVLIVVAVILIIFIIEVVVVARLVFIWVLQWTLLDFSNVCDSPLDEIVSALLSFDLITFVFIIRYIEGSILNSTSVFFDPLLPFLWVFFAPFTLFLPSINV